MASSVATSPRRLADMLSKGGKPTLEELKLALVLEAEQTTNARRSAFLNDMLGLAQQISRLQSERDRLKEENTALECALQEAQA
ncbi:hypothetical protein ABPG75_003635 [Micractinium tetrahymenae]